MRSPIADLRRFARRLFRSSAPTPPGEARFDALARLHELYGGNGSAPSVLWLGDSVLERVAREDADQRSLAAILEGELPCAVISHSAYHPQVYQQLLQALQQMPQRPELLVVPINIRCFSPQWDLHPEFQFELELAALRRYIASPSDAAANVTIEFQPTSEAHDAYARQPVEYAGSSCKTLGDFLAIRDGSPTEGRDRRLAAIFELHYMHPLQRDHRKLRSLVEIATLVNDSGIQTLFYMTPLNYQAGVRYCGPVFTERLASNVAIASEALQPFINARTMLADFGRLVPSDEFVHSDIANEHLNEQGRTRLAAEVITRARALLKSDR